MNLILPSKITSELIDALQRAGRREVGGVLMAEHVHVDTFRIKQITVQRKAGTYAAFTRLVEEILKPLRAFFDATKHDYTRFNYIGEWHSHHSFELTPSPRDHSTMLDIIMDRDFGALFVVLLLVRLGDSDDLEHAVTVYRPDRRPVRGLVKPETE